MKRQIEIAMVVVLLMLPVAAGCSYWFYWLCKLALEHGQLWLGIFLFVPPLCGYAIYQTILSWILIRRYQR